MTSLLQQVGIRQGQRVLDVGFGDLRELEEIASLVEPAGSVLGIEVLQRAVEEASRELSETSKANISVKAGTVADIPAEDQTFDLVLCKGLLHEVRDLDEALAEMSRVCVEHGEICIIDFQRFSRIRFELYRIKTCLQGRSTSDVHPGFSRGQLARLITDHGLDVVRYQEYPDKWRMGSIEVHPFLLKAKRGR